jgi:AraC-like DNA-binding protein/CheY-like chemotaxis protein
MQMEAPVLERSDINAPARTRLRLVSEQPESAFPKNKVRRLETNKAMFDLINAAQLFLLRCTSLRPAQYGMALGTFAGQASTSGLPMFAIETVLVRCLHELDLLYGRTREVGFVDRYLSQVSHPAVCVDVFFDCLQNAAPSQDYRNQIARAAEAIIEQRYSDPLLRPNSVAKALGRSLSSLSAAFRAEGLTFGQCVRRVRLEAAVKLLATRGGRIKDVWTEIGYNDPSNFDHHFRSRFGMSPRAYRTLLVNRPSNDPPPDMEITSQIPPISDKPRTILLIDHDAEMRQRLSSCFRGKGYTVFSASNGIKGIAKAASLSPDVILLEQNLPKLRGLDCLAELQHYASTKVLFTADWTVDADATEALGAKVALKPMSPDRLANLINRTH